MKVISVINNKGGVGKTMTAQNLGAALALHGKKVCCIDLDSQHNLTNRYENKGRESELSEGYYAGKTIGEYLEDTSIAISPVYVKQNLWLIPSTVALAATQARLYAMKASERPSYRLKDICLSLDAFDYIVIDCEPGMSALMANAAIAADLILIPVSCQDALIGAGDGVFRLLHENNLQTPAYFLQTMYEERFKAQRDIKRRLLADAFENTLRTQIKRNEYLNKAGDVGADVFELAPKSQGASDYDCLALEIMGLINKGNKK